MHHTIKKLMRIYPLFILMLIYLTPSLSQTDKKSLPYYNPNLPIDARVEDLLGRMTLREKVGQMQCEIKPFETIDSLVRIGIGNLAITVHNFGSREAAEKSNLIQKMAVEETRLGIPILIHDEALHGLSGKEATSFPQAIGLAATWNPDLMSQIARVIAVQTRARGIRQVLSPVVNIARDVRWGRVEETYGEDPYLTTQFGVAFCRIIEQEGVITTPKHFAANVGDGGRDSHPVHFNERLLREIYFPAFKACFQEGHATSVMPAYNSLDGLACTANRWLLTDILRNEWGFDGFVVSDYGSAGGIRDAHRMASTKGEVAHLALEAGLDIELPGIYIYADSLLLNIEQGITPEDLVDNSVRRILRAKFRLGLFESPYVDPETAVKVTETPGDRALALRAAHESIVLLKNESNILPLKKDLRSIAVIGPDADGKRLGGYSGYGMKIVSVLEGVKAKVSPKTTVYYAKGCELGELALPAILSEHLVPAGGKKGERGLKAEYFGNQELTGEPVLVRIDKQLNFDWGAGSPDSTIKPDHFSVRWTGKFISPLKGRYKFSITTDDGVRLYVDGKQLVNNWVDRGPTSDYFILNLEKGRAYDLRIEMYENGGGSYASLGWKGAARETNTIEEATALAKKSDAVVFVGGIMEGEGRDRADLRLPGQQEELLKAITRIGIPTVVVLVAGSAVTMESWYDDVPAIIDAWYSGEEGGNAVADVLFGDYNPGGKLPITFPQSAGQCPLYYNVKPSGRGYDYVNMSGKPLFAFGHGLSYTTFEYSNIKIEKPEISRWENITVHVDIRNTGTQKGEEVVQLYIHDPVASVTRPLMELKGFKRISLEPGEKMTISFILKPDDLSFLDADLKRTIESGTFEVMIGSSSDDIRQRGNFIVK